MIFTASADTEDLVGVIRAVPGVCHLYSAHPTLVTVATQMVGAVGSANPSNALIVMTDESVRVRVGIDHTRSTAQVGAALYEAIDHYVHRLAPHLEPKIQIEIEIASIR